MLIRTSDYAIYAKRKVIGNKIVLKNKKVDKSKTRFMRNCNTCGKKNSETRNTVF